MRKKRIIIALIFLLILSIILFSKFYPTGKSVNVEQIQVTPLNLDEKQKIESILLSNEFLQNIPESDPVSIRFFTFVDGQRVWNNEFVFGGGKILQGKTPTIYLILHSKYIPRLNENNICDIIKEANQNGDLGFYSDENKAMLFIKYVKMLEYRDCFGF